MHSLLFAALPLFLQVEPAPAAPATPAAPTGRVLHLNEAVDAGLKNQPTLHLAHAQTNVADARAGEAKAPLLPQVVGLASYTRRSATGTVGATGATTTPGAGAGSFDFFSFGGTATQLIWDFGHTYNSYRAADRFTRSAEAAEKTAAQNVVLDVRHTYFAARAQKELVGVAKENVANLERHLRQTEGFVKVGTQPEIALAQNRTDLANGQVTLINAENAYAVAKANVLRAMGDPNGEEFDVADDEIAAIDGEDLPIEKLALRALEKRPELVALERQKESQVLSVRSARGNYGPALTASGGASESGLALDSLAFGWNVGVALTWPVFQGCLTKSQVREAEANVDATQAQLDGEKLQIRVDIKQAALSLHAAKATQAATEIALTNAKELLRLAEGRYTSGVGSVIELGDAQVAATNAAAQAVQARFSLSSARADLLAALGQR